MPLPIAQDMIQSLSSEIKASSMAGQEELEGLLEDLTGQVAEAFSREDWYTKWGVHYLPSLMFAHLTQQCNNFKDAGVQSYGGQLFGELRDTADEVFLNLPHPTPSAAPAPRLAAPVASALTPMQPQQAVPVNMAAFHDRFAGCIAGNCNVHMADGSTRRVDEIRKGDVVAAAMGFGPAEVQCVVRTLVQGSRLPLVELPGGGRVTAYHPVLLDGEWRFPVDVAPAVEQECRAVYTFVLEEGARAIIVDGLSCVPMGHSVKDGAARHPFLGSRASAHALAKLPGFDCGLVDLGSACRAVRDMDTGLICDFVQC